jgi:hypothetical protein
VSKRRGSRYRSGRCDDWRKTKNPAAPAAIRSSRKIGAGPHGADLSTTTARAGCSTADIKPRQPPPISGARQRRGLARSAHRRPGRDCSAVSLRPAPACFDADWLF